MENNNTNSQKKTKKLIAVLAIIFAVCAAGLAGAWFLKNNSVQNVENDLPSDGTEIKEEMTVSDAETLRELLLSEEEIAITLTEDVRIEETLIVRGTKKLSGNHSIIMELYAEPYGSVLEVYRDGDLVLDGITVDGNGIANGVTVKTDAGLTCLSGTITYAAPYALEVKGKAVVKNIVIDEIIHTGVSVNSRGEVIWEGGTVRNCTNALIHVAEKGYMNISGDSVFEQSGVNGIMNYGKIDMTGGVIREANNYLVYNDGEFNVDYKGKDKDDRLEWHTCGQSGVRSGFDAVTNLNNVYIHNTGQWALRLYETMGGTTVTNCLFENARRKESVSVYKSTAVLKDVTIRDTLAGIIIQGSESTLDMDGITITNVTKGRGIENHSATVTGKNIYIDGVETYGITTSKDEGEAVGSVTLSDVVIKNTRTKTAFNSNGSVFKITNAKVYNSGDCGIQIIKGGSGTFNNVKIYDAKSVGLNLLENAKATFNDVSLIRCKTKDSSVLIDKTSKFTMNGKSVITECEGRGVYCAGSFVMNGGEISNNGGTKGRLAAGVRIDKTGSFVMNGGSIHDNNSITAGGGVMAANKFEMNGGSIYNNRVNHQGGGIYLVDGCQFTMKGGSILNNVSKSNGGAIYVAKKCDVKLIDGEINGNTVLNGIVDGVQVSVGAKITMNSKFNMGSNMIKINWSKVADKMLLRLEGDKFSEHNKELPLIVYPSGSTPLYGDVIECDSAEAAKNLVGSIVSGDGRYAYYADGKYIRVNAAHADLDMTGVTDVVAVTNYQELKEAVTTTKDKRIIKICADIEMEGTISVPNGTTVQIMDDGVKRTLSRADGKVSQFFLTYYGTGLILQGTDEGNLVLDGACSPDADATKLKVVLQMQGASRMENVTFTNSDTTKYSTTLFGGYVHQQFAETEITNCTFENAICNAGSAIRLDGKATITDSTFRNNQAVSNEAGAIYVTEKGAVLKAYGCTFENNSAVKNGGAIFFREGAGACSIQDCTFIGNTAAREKTIYGGAVHVSENVSVDFVDTVFRDNTACSTGANAFAGAINNKGTITMTNCTFDKNNASTEAEKDGYAYGGAILNQGNMTATDCQFTENASINKNTASHGGAVYMLGANASVNFVATEGGNAIFKDNTAANWGGAIVFENTALDNVTIQGYTFEGNTAGNGGTVRLEGASGARMEKVTFKGNNASNAGGAVFVDDTSQLQIVNSIFSENVAGKSGGAIYVNANTTVTIENTLFEKNNATTEVEAYAYGGAIFSKGDLTATDCQFVENASKITTSTGSATHGGAIYIDAATLKDGDADAVLKLEKTADGTAIFQKNTSTSHGGAIVLDHTKLDKVEIKGYSFNEGNSSKDGGVIYLDGAGAKMDSVTFTGNSATGGGGAVFAKAGSTLEIANSTLESNTAGSRGGVMYSNGSSVTISGTTGFTSNKVTGGGKTGGAIYATGGSLTVAENSNVTFANNSSVGTGGALHLENVTTNINRKAVFSENKAATQGGAIYVTGGSTTITGAEFKKNLATNSSDNALGGAIYVNTTGTTLSLTETIFEENQVTNVASGKEAQGGAIYSKGALTATDCQFKNNKVVKGSGVAKGGAVFITGAGAKATFTKTANGTATFEGNTASNWGGAMVLVTTTKDNISIDGYTFSGNTSSGDGGALYLRYTPGAKISNATFENNSAAGGGGAVFVNGDNGVANVQVMKSKFTGNHSPKKGGAMYLASPANGKIEISGSEFKQNYVQGNADGTSGGAVYVASSTTVVEMSTTLFEGNHVTQTGSKEAQGGAIWSTGNLTATDCQFKTNKVVKGTGAGRGGAVYIYGASAVARFTKTANGTALFQGNTSTDWAGAVMLQGTALNNITIQGYTFDGNSASNGAAVRLQGGNSGAKIQDAVFTNNTATGGGGAVFAQGETTNKRATIQINNGTFTGNTGSSKGGAVYLNCANATFTGTFTFSGNSSSNGADIYNTNTTLQLPTGLNLSVKTE